MPWQLSCTKWWCDYSSYELINPLWIGCQSHTVMHCSSYNPSDADANGVILIIQIWYVTLYLACTFSLVYFSVEVCLVGVFPHSVSIWSDPCIRACVPLMNWRPPSRENNIVQGVTRFSTWAKRGGIWIDARVCLHYWVVIWVAGYCNPPYIAQFLGYVMGRIHMTLRSYSVLDILLPPIIIIMQECSQALKTCKRL